MSEHTHKYGDWDYKQPLLDGYYKKRHCKCGAFEAVRYRPETIRDETLADRESERQERERWESGG